jgi:glutaredoxin/glutathione-dependent peroxiredoxin
MTCKFSPAQSPPPGGTTGQETGLTKPLRIDYQDTTNVDEKGIAFTIRSVFVIDPKKTIRTILQYPASTGRNSAEILRIVDSLQTGDKNRVTTPVNWVPGDDVIVHPSVKGQEAKDLFPNLREVKPYLRFTPLPKAS